MEKSEPLYIAGKNVKCALENSLAVPQKAKHKVTYDPAIPRLGVFPRELKIRVRTQTCTGMFKAALFIISKGWKQPKCPSNDE